VFGVLALHYSRGNALALAPRDFEAVLDLLDPFDVPENFLGHLLLEVRLHRALEHDAAPLGFEPQSAAPHVGTGLEGLIDTLGEGFFERGHGAGTGYGKHWQSWHSVLHHSGGRPDLACTAVISSALFSTRAPAEMKLNRPDDWVNRRNQGHCNACNGKNGDNGGCVPFAGVVVMGRGRNEPLFLKEGAFDAQNPVAIPLAKGDRGLGRLSREPL
jgi:hypothetical protein